LSHNPEEKYRTLLKSLCGNRMHGFLITLVRSFSIAKELCRNPKKKGPEGNSSWFMKIYPAG